MVDKLSDSPEKRAFEYLQDFVAMHPGEPVPSELMLARTLGVSRNTVRVALKQLEAQGLIQCLGRRKGRIAALRSNSTAELLTHTAVIAANVFGNHRVPARMPLQVKPEVILADALCKENYYTYTVDTEIIGNTSGSPFLDLPPVAIVVTTDRISDPEQFYRVLSDLRSKGVAVVVSGDEPESHAFSRVCFDWQYAGEKIVHALIKRNRKTLLPITHPVNRHSERQKLWFEGLSNAACCESVKLMSPLELPVSGKKNHRSEADLQAYARVLVGLLIDKLTGENAADAIIAPSDADVFPIAAALKLLSKEINTDVDVTGIGDDWQYRSEIQSEPAEPLITVNLKPDVVAAKSIELLLDQLQGISDNAPVRVCIRPEIVSNV